MTFDTRILFSALVGLVMLERGLELFLSVRNARQALARGGVEAGRRHTRWMVLVHTAFLFSCLGEVWLLSPPFVPALAAAMLPVIAGTMALRYWAIAALGERWNTRVITVPGDTVVQDGPYRFMRHPNYVAVALEIPALPLVHAAWITATVFGLANLVLLRVRIRVEENALAACSDYGSVFAARPRFVPGRRRAGPDTQ